jgi:long-chain acyl-CoA synthetase
MKEIRPTVFVGVPRVYEKIRQAVEQKSAASPLKKRMLSWALNVGTHHRNTVYDGRQPASFFWKVANKLVYSKVREAFGGRVRIWVSGGAPLGIDTAKWFASVGIAVWEGYGLTETSPVIALNNPAVHRMGAVGKPLPNIDLRFAEDGELLVRGPSVFVGYWHKPSANAGATSDSGHPLGASLGWNAECFDVDGFFRTGDIARFDDDGFLYITDRKKELLKTSGGKLVAPQPIENKLKNSVMIAQCALVGDKHKFISALISPNFAALEAWATHAGLEATDRQALVSDSRVIALYGEVVREANAGLANFETIKRFRLVADEWSQDTGELTPSMKLKRRVISAKYGSVVDELYADEATSRAE